MTNLLFEPPFGGLRGNVRTSAITRWKTRGQLPICDNWTFFRYLLRLRRYLQILVEVGAFQREWVTLRANFRWKGLSPPNHCWYQKTRVFLLPHSEDRVILCSSVWIGYQRVTDRRTDRQTDGQTDGQTELLYVLQRSALKAMRPGCKNTGLQRQIDVLQPCSATQAWPGLTTSQ